MRSRRRFLVGLCLWGGLAGVAGADTLYPARLEMVEAEPGVFDVGFHLPVQNLMRIKAAPALPAVCVDAESRQVTSTETKYAEEWRVECDADALVGQPVGVEGLLGSPIDVLLSIRTLDGRRYDATLKPSRAVYVVPEPPGPVGLSSRALVRGMRDTFVHLEVAVALFLLALARRPRRDRMALLGAAVAGFAAAQALARASLLLVPTALPEVLVLLGAAVAAVRLAEGGDATPATPTWGGLPAALAGALYGAASPGPRLADELSRFEGRVALGAFTLGVAVGLVVLGTLGKELVQILLPRAGAGGGGRLRLLATVAGVGSVGLLVHRLSAAPFLAAVTPSAPLAVLASALAIGAWAGRPAGAGPARWLVVSPLLFVAGLAVGTAGHPIPGASIAVAVSLFGLGIGFAMRPVLPRWAMASLALSAACCSAVEAGVFIQENLSQPMAHVLGSGLLATLALVIGREWGRRIEEGSSSDPLAVRILGVGLALFAVASSLQQVVGWLGDSFAVDAAMGFVRVPLLSLSLVLLAVLFWPRRSRVARELDLAVKRPVAHGAALALAFFLLPIGAVRVSNPLFDTNAPRADQAQRILANLLTNTYTAFNLQDEEELYDQLSHSVGEDLVEDLYLDGRRRLTAGVREGSSVTVRDVGVHDVGAPREAGGESGEFAYQCRWVVTARVQHLQHVHHRQNTYTGTLTLRIDAGAWKIEAVELESEDRAVVPGRPV